LTDKEFEEKLKKQNALRDIASRAVVNSSFPRKVIVSGPGTGKTFTFRKLLKTKKGDCLALTFINNLAVKLKDDIGRYAKVCTFHSFCKEMLHNAQKDDLTENFIVFPELEMIIQSDARILHAKSPNFSRSFHNLDLSNQNIEFFLRRSSFYDTVSFDDSVYRVLEYFKYNTKKIPKYSQIVVDEYQDFNKLEVEFLNILAEKSPILIVGDDDQALYGRLKNASARYIREKYNDPNYQHFCLPYCSRCTLVITHAVADIITSAKNIGKLRDRIDKRYRCYLPTKWKDSKYYPYIVHAQCSTQKKSVPYIAKFIEQEINGISPKAIKAANMKADYTVLVVGSSHYLKQVQDYFKGRNDKYKLFFRKEKKHYETFKILDGYKTLLQNGKNSNLGWRILLEFDRITKMKAILQETEKSPSSLLVKLLPSGYVKRHMDILQILKELLAGERLSVSEKRKIEKLLNMSSQWIKDELAKKEGEKIDNGVECKEDDISIVFTTHVGCKGLSAGYVFIIGLDEESLPRKNHSPTDIEICNFIVALTRTIKKCYLVSTFRFSGKPRKHSVFIDWIHEDRLKPIKVNKEYFAK
jgi:superfamily I DNA/RNA helicase